jgi:choice-of-anchor C domain-containing protein
VRKTSIGAAISLVASLALASSVFAAGPYANGSFEQGTYGGGGFQTLVAGTPNATAMDGWTVTAGSVDWVSNSYLTWQSEDGTYSVDMNGSSSSGVSAIGTISQTFDTTPNDTYTVEFWVSNNTACGPSTKSMTASAGSASETVEVDSSHDVYQGQWLAADALTFVATSDSATVEFAADPSNTSNCGVAVDNVTVTQTASTGAQCKRGGWHSMVETADSLFTPFKNQGACVSSYAKAGLVPIGTTTGDQTGDPGATSDPGAQCKNGAWKTMTDANGAAFKNQGACVSSYARGGAAPHGK